MTKVYLTTIAVLLFQWSSAQGWRSVGARSLSLSGTVVASRDVWSYHHNPAGIAYVQKISAGLSYENRYLLKELQTQGMVVAVPLKIGVISAGVQSYGYRIYRTMRVGAGYSMKLAERIAAGVQLNYQGMRIENYGTRSNVTAEAGITADVTSDLTLGFSVMNIGRSKLAEFQDERYTTVMRLGLAYSVSGKVLILGEVQKEITSKLRPKLAVEYELLSDFFLRIGGAYNPPELSFGIGYIVKKAFKIDIGSAWQQHLGWCPHVGFTYELKKM